MKKFYEKLSRSSDSAPVVDWYVPTLDKPAQVAPGGALSFDHKLSIQTIITSNPFS